MMAEMGVTDSQAGVFAQQLVAQLASEGRESTLRGNDLLRLLYEGIGVYGTLSWEPFVSLLMPVYVAGMEHLSTGERLQLEGALRLDVEAGKTSLNVFMPFVLVDNDPAVVSTAIVDLAMLPEPPDGDPLHWPQSIIDDLAARRGASPGAMLGGLLCLGDRRVNELLEEVRWQLTEEELRVAANCVTGMPSMAAVDFWTRGLEALAGAGLEASGAFGTCASALAVLAQRKQTDCFSEMERNFGYMHQGNGASSMVIHGQWTTLETGEQFAERWYALEAAESAPKIMSHVLAEYGLVPNAPIEERALAQ